MSESKHTPGPWQAEMVDSVVRIHGGIFAGATRAVVEVADVWVPDGENGDAAQVANAALIASAPDLLEALKAMLAHACVADADPNDKDAEDHAAERMARAAIAKATGAKATGGRDE